MKKTLAAIAVLGAFAGSAVAADVTLYGKIDTGFVYNNVNTSGVVPGADDETFEMSTGVNSGSRWGLKGTEDLGNGLKVGFVLEGGFKSDTGALGADKTIFDRESTVSISGDFGKVLAGRMGALVYGAGSVSKIGMISAFGTSYSADVAQVGASMSMASRWNNAIAYESPNFGGLVVRAQYAMGSSADAVTTAGKEDAAKVENESSTDRYYAVSATYANGPVNAFFAVDSVNYDSVKATGPVDMDDSLTVTLGGNYDLGAAKIYAGAQYFDEVKLGSFNAVAIDEIDDIEIAKVKVKGYGLNLSASTAVAGGTAAFGVAYMDAEVADSEAKKTYAKADFQRYAVSAAYTYNLSKRTYAYGLVSYNQDKITEPSIEDIKLQTVKAAVGLVHNF